MLWFCEVLGVSRGSRGLGSSRECWRLWGFWVVFGVLEISGGFGEPLRCFGGVWGILGGFRGGSGVSLRCFGGLWGCLPLLTPPPAVCVLYTQSPGSHQWREVSDLIGGGQPISMLGCAQLANWYVSMYSASQSRCWGTSWPTNHQHAGAVNNQRVCVPTRWPISMSEVMAASQPSSM